VFASLRVPEHDLVVVSGGHDLAGAGLGKTPDLTIVVGHHEVHLVSTLVAGDGAVTLANKELVAHAVDGADEGGELNRHGDSVAGRVNAVNLAILGAGEELAFGETESADESLVERHGLLASATIIATPDVEPSVGTTSVAFSIAVPSCASKGGLLVSAVETALLVARSITSIPEFDVLDTSGRESLGTRLFVPADIVNLVSITILLHDLLARTVEHVHLMVVVTISGANPAFGVDGDSLDTTSALGDLYPLLLLAAARVPGEDGGRVAILAGDGGVTVSVETQAQNIIRVVFTVVRHVLRRVFDLATTEEFLRVGLGVEDDAEGGGHVDSGASAVPVDVLLGVSASVAVDVLKFVGDVGLFVVDWVVLIGLSDLSFPG